MEHRPLSDYEIIERCCLNLTETYIEIAKHADGFRVFEDEGMFGCQSDLEHPSGNVIFVARPTVQSLSRLQERRSSFSGLSSFYILPTSQSEFVAESLVRIGLKRASKLHLMFFRGSVTEPKSELISVGPRMRKVITRQMADLFFGHVQPQFCSDLSYLLTQSRCDLWTEPLSGTMAMTHRTGDVSGIYNVGVPPVARSVGNGTRMIEALTAQSLKSSKYLTLQCHEPLVEWYERLGFRKYGEVTLMH